VRGFQQVGHLVDDDVLQACPGLLRPSVDVRPVTEFRSHTSAALEQVQRTKRPVILTQHGRSAAVLLSIDVYEDLVDQVAVIQDIRTAQAQLDAGMGIPKRDRRETSAGAVPEVRVEWSPLADEQVDDAVAYISAEDPTAALRWLERLLDRTKSLTTFPDSGRVVPEIGRRDIRTLPVSPYRVMYRRTDDRVRLCNAAAATGRPRDCRPEHDRVSRETPACRGREANPHALSPVSNARASARRSSRSWPTPASISISPRASVRNNSSSSWVRSYA
jgi:antitoxin YefM